MTTTICTVRLFLFLACCSCWRNCCVGKETDSLSDSRPKPSVNKITNISTDIRLLQEDNLSPDCRRVGVDADSVTRVLQSILTESERDGILAPQVCLPLRTNDNDPSSAPIDQRCFHVFVSASTINTGQTATKLPLVLDVHGSGNCPSIFAGFSGWARLASSQPMIIVWPLGSTISMSGTCFGVSGGFPLNSSNGQPAPPCCCDDTTVDDTVFFRTILRYMLQQEPTAFDVPLSSILRGKMVDPDRIYMTGHSNGCIASMAMAASQSRNIADSSEPKIAGVACFAGTQVTAIDPSYAPIPIWSVHGRDDHVLPLRGTSGLFPSTDEVFQQYQQRHGCENVRPIRQQRQGKQLEIHRFVNGCSAPLERITVDGVGHTPYQFQDGTGDLDTTTMAWDFFQQHYTAPSRQQQIASDVVGKVIVGYQGFYGVPQDPPRNWLHWTTYGTSPPRAGSVTVDLYPELTEYTETFDTGLGFLGNNPNRKARVFSSHRASTIRTHLQWMRDYDIHGLALQRFPSEFQDTVLLNLKGEQMKNIREAAEATGRKFYIMYDITRLPQQTGSDIASVRGGFVLNRRPGQPRTWFQTILYDLKHRVEPNVLSSPAYARHDNKPVLCIWGIGFADEGPNTKPGTAEEHLRLVQTLQRQHGYFVIGGVPFLWRTTQGVAQAGFEAVYRELDMISPWSVGRLQNLPQVDQHVQRLEQDLDFCCKSKSSKHYQPVVYPGFSFHNVGSGLPLNQIPRMAGQLMWRQVYNIVRVIQKSGDAGVGIYVAMFDEMDEGTAILKIASDSTVIPHDQDFVTTSTDGTFQSSDFYLRLIQHGGKVLKGERQLTDFVPIPNSAGPVWFRTGVEFGLDGVPLADVVFQDTIVGITNARLYVEEQSPMGFPGGRQSAIKCIGTDPDPSGPSFAYFHAFNVDIPIFPETQMSYWFLPEQENGRYISVDLIVRSEGDGNGPQSLTLRDSGAVGTTTVLQRVVDPVSGEEKQEPIQEIRRMHPGVLKGIMGQATQVKCSIGQFLPTGSRIEKILIAYDRGQRQVQDGEQFSAFLDDIEITGPVLS